MQKKFSCKYLNYYIEKVIRKGISAKHRSDYADFDLLQQKWL
jgi:hypothetical protein